MQVVCSGNLLLTENVISDDWVTWEQISQELIFRMAPLCHVISEVSLAGD